VCGEVWNGVSKGKECVCVWCILLNWRGCARYGRLNNWRLDYELKIADVELSRDMICMKGKIEVAVERG
jgi:hypothetical protein